MKRFLVTLGLLLAFSAQTQGAVWYVSPNGGTDAECDGTSPIDFDGVAESGAEVCAWNGLEEGFGIRAGNSQYANKLNIAGGDTIIVLPGTYTLGYNNGRFSCSSTTTSCHPYGIPSGPSPDNPTRILGAGWATGCSPATRPIFTVDQSGTTRELDAAIWLDRDPVDNIEISCLELTDPTEGVFGANANFLASENQYLCSPSAGDSCMQDGIVWGFSTKTAFENLTFRHIYAHGIAANCLNGKAPVKNLVIEDSEFKGCGRSGVNIDEGSTGTYVDVENLTFRRSSITWAGCTSPDDPGPKNVSGEANFCHEAFTGGYGDGWGMGIGRGDFVIEDIYCAYATSDCLDFLYYCRDTADTGQPSTMPDAADCGGSITVKRLYTHSSSGSGWKNRGSPFSMDDSQVEGNCDWHRSRAQNGNGYPNMKLNISSTCRASGPRLSINSSNGPVTLNNVTASSESTTAFSFMSGSATFRPSVNNSLFFAWSPNFNDDPYTSFSNDALADIDWSNSYALGLGGTTTVALDCSGTAGLTCADPQVEGYERDLPDRTPAAGGIAENGAVGYQGTGYDRRLGIRPAGNEDIGAIERGATILTPPGQ